jgi:hypothetical protein
MQRIGRFSVLAWAMASILYGEAAVAQTARDAQFGGIPPVHLVREVADPDAACRHLLPVSDRRKEAARVVSCTYPNPIAGQPKIEVLPSAYAYWRAHPDDRYAQMKACEDEWANGRPGDEDDQAWVCDLGR